MPLRTLFRVLVIAIALSFVSVSVTAQTSRAKIAEIYNNGSNVSWRVLVPNEGFTLTVSTPSGQVFRRDYSAGATAVFSPVSERGIFYDRDQTSSTIKEREFKIGRDYSFSVSFKHSF